MASFVCQCWRVNDIKLSLVQPRERETQVREAQTPRELDSGTIGSWCSFQQLQQCAMCREVWCKLELNNVW